MEFGSIDRPNEPDTDEFEKLEFLPEEPVESSPGFDDTSEIIFTPEHEPTPEPPVSFDLGDDAGSPAGFDIDDSATSPTLDVDGGMPFELFGTSLFGDPELDEDLEILDHDELDDDLEF